ncbi:MAG: hypothetical protein Q27BB25_13060 [Blastomonas sp. CACIA14H2]|nr:MAG: hypothetical protein Q27BB25_13060 [Blastomonas sp. CACIA14H2]
MRPVATAIESRCGGSQNRKLPQVSQKPRRTLGLDWYQRRCSSPVMLRSLRLTSVEAQ